MKAEVLWKRTLYGSAVAVLATCVALLVWQGSFSFGEYGPGTPEQTLLVWSVSSLVVVLTLTLAWVLIRNLIKLYIERQTNREGSRIQTKLVIGALGLTLLPVCFLVFFGINIMNRNLEKWFRRPAEEIKGTIIEVAQALQETAQARTESLAAWVAATPEVRTLWVERKPRAEWGEFCQAHALYRVTLEFADGSRVLACETKERAKDQRQIVVATAPVAVTPDVAMARPVAAQVRVETLLPLDLVARVRVLERAVADQNQLIQSSREVRRFYFQLMLLITLFILFLAAWVAIFFARQISKPISALLAASKQVRAGNFAYRVDAPAMDELATLVRGFNDMTQDLETSHRELERRQRFVEAILENIPTGVVSVSADGKVQSFNGALRQFVPGGLVEASRLDDLFEGADLAEIRYLMGRARRTRLASNQIDLTIGGKTLPVNVTVSAIEDQWRLSFIIVLEDMSEVLRVQRMEAWQEVARSVAHEIRNPLTPIALSAERIVRQLEKAGPEAGRVIRECAETINGEVASLKSLVDEFAQAARFPAAQPQTTDLNELIEHALAVFEGRLSGVQVIQELDPQLPLVEVDREQFKRVLVNLIDNAAEAMATTPVKRLLITTRSVDGQAVELVVADTGCGISSEDKEKLFLPYFSTKNRGTGLGLAIVNHILTEHHATIRVEDNRPSGAAFLVEVPLSAAEGVTV